MKRTIFIGLGLIIIVALLLPQASDMRVTAQAGPTPARLGVHWDKYHDVQAVAPEFIKLYIDLQVRCDGQVVLSQVLDLNGPALELGEGLFRGFDWNWGEWTPPPDMVCVEWQRIRWEVPGVAEAVLDGQPFAGQLFGEYWPSEGKETREDANHFWYFGPLANGDWWDRCPGAPDCETPGPTPTEQPTLTPRPTYTPEPTDTPPPTPTCRPTPTCPPSWPTQPPHPTATHYPTATRYPTPTPWPTQPPL